MLFEFTRNGISKKLNEKSATPAIISKLFKVTLDSLALVGNGDYIDVEDNAFSESLEDGSVYEVEGDSMITVKTADVSIIRSFQGSEKQTTSVVPIGKVPSVPKSDQTNDGHSVVNDATFSSPQIECDSSRQIESCGAPVIYNSQSSATQNMLAISAKDQLLEVVSSVAEATLPLHEGVGLLHDSPNAVILLESLAILSTSTDDPSLISKNMSRDQFQHITSPDSFRTAICQLSMSMSNAFRKADTSMEEIRSCLVDMPNDIAEALAEFASGSGTKKLNRLIKNMEKSSEHCKKNAEGTNASFSYVHCLLEEIIIAATAAQSANETGIHDSEKKRKILENYEKAHKDRIATLEADRKKIAKAAQDAFEHFKETRNSVSLLKLFGLSFVNIFNPSKNLTGDYLDTHTKNRENASARLDSAEKRQDENSELLRQSKKEFADLMAEIQNLDLTKVDMEGVILCLRKGLTYLSNAREHWTNLADFFGNLRIVVSNHLCRSIENFTGGIRDEYALESLIKPALRLSGYCIQISNCATVYKKVSRKYIVPTLDALPKTFALSQKDAQAKQLMLGSESKKINEDVGKLIETEMVELNENYMESLESQQVKLLRAIDQ